MNRKPFDLSILSRCGAQTRSGTPCQRAGNLRTGRCKLHGGRSTGPKTAVGRKACGKPHLKHGDHRHIRLWRELRWIVRVNGYLISAIYNHSAPQKTRRAVDWLARNFDEAMLERLGPEAIERIIVRLLKG